MELDGRADSTGDVPQHPESGRAIPNSHHHPIPSSRSPIPRLPAPPSSHHVSTDPRVTEGHHQYYIFCRHYLRVSSCLVAGRARGRLRDPPAFRVLRRRRSARKLLQLLHGLSAELAEHRQPFLGVGGASHIHGFHLHARGEGEEGGEVLRKRGIAVFICAEVVLGCRVAGRGALGDVAGACPIQGVGRRDVPAALQEDVADVPGGVVGCAFRQGQAPGFALESWCRHRCWSCVGINHTVSRGGVKRPGGNSQKKKKPTSFTPAGKISDFQNPLSPSFLSTN